MVEDWLAVHRKAGLSNAAVHVSRAGDSKRWIHGYRSSNPDLNAADELFLPDVLAPKPASPALPPRGRLIVPCATRCQVAGVPHLCRSQCEL